MGLEIRPYSKEEQLKYHKKPKQKGRTRITKQNYNRMIDEFGEYCQMCGYAPIEAHHIFYRSQYGCGNWRNLAPLCKRCHERAHKDRAFADLIREMRAERFGNHFYKDVYTLFKEGLIPEPTEEEYNKFLVSEEKKHAGQVE